MTSNRGILPKKITLVWESAASSHNCDNHASFDRTLCACGSMHYYCSECGKQLDKCRPASEPKEEA